MNHIKAAKTLLLLSLFVAPDLLAKSASDWIAEGERQWANQQLEQAESSFRRAISAAPDDADAHARLAGLLLAANRNADAAAAYQEAIIRAPQRADLFVGIALAYLHEGQFSRAQAMIDQALTLQPEQAEARKLSQYITFKQEALNRQHAAPAH